MTHRGMIFRNALILAAAASLGACSSAPGVSFGGGAGGVVGYAPPSSSKGCSPQTGAVGGIKSVAAGPSGPGNISTGTASKPPRAVSGKDAPAAAGKPSRQSSGSDHVAGTGIQAPGSGC